MTISSTTRKAGPFDGNDATTAFPFTFKVFAAADLRVVLTTPSGVESDLVLDTDYSVALNGDQDANPGGTVTYPVSGDPLVTDWRLTVIGDIDYLQPTDITNGGGFYPQVIENSLDRNVMLIQQVAEVVGRTIRVAVSDDVTAGLELPAAASRADRVLGFDADGNFKVYDTSISVRATGLEVFTATSGQTAFTTPFTYTPNANSMLVIQNGAVLTPGVDFIETSSTIFTLTVGATVGDTVVALAGLDTSGGVQGAQIVDGSVTSDKLVDGILTADTAGRLKMADGYITTAKILDANVTTAKIPDANVTDAKIATMSASKLTGDIAAARVTNALSATGTAPIFAARAWIVFNGTGTPAITAGGNVSSITDHGTGDYTLTFTTALPDANYAVSGSSLSTTGYGIVTVAPGSTPSTTAVRISTLQLSASSPTTSSIFDSTRVSVVIHR